MAANENSGNLEARFDELRGEIGALSDRVEGIFVGIAGIAGLENVAGGVAQVVEMLRPLRDLVPPTVREEFPDDTARAIANMQEAIGFPDDRPPAPDRLPIVDPVIPFIGDPAALPAAAPARTRRA